MFTNKQVQDIFLLKKSKICPIIKIKSKSGFVFEVHSSLNFNSFINNARLRERENCPVFTSANGTNYKTLSCLELFQNNFMP